MLYGSSPSHGIMAVHPHLHLKWQHLSCAAGQVCMPHRQAACMLNACSAAQHLTSTFPQNPDRGARCCISPALSVVCGKPLLRFAAVANVLVTVDSPSIFNSGLGSPMPNSVLGWAWSVVWPCLCVEHSAATSCWHHRPCHCVKMLAQACREVHKPLLLSTY